MHKHRALCICKEQSLRTDCTSVHSDQSLCYLPRLAKRWEILIFPRTAGNTGNSRELLVIPGNYWEIGNWLLTY